MPHDVDAVPGEGWAFWTAIALSGAVICGASLHGDRWWVTVVGLLATLGALNQVVTEVRHAFETVEHNARRDEQARIRRAMIAAGRARLEQLNRGER